MNKNELAAAISALTGQAVNPDSHTRAELERLYAELAAAPPASAQPVRVRLGADAPVGTLIVGVAQITRELAADISQADYAHLAEEYHLVVVPPEEAVA